MFLFLEMASLLFPAFSHGSFRISAEKFVTLLLNKDKILLQSATRYTTIPVSSIPISFNAFIDLKYFCSFYNFCGNCDDWDYCWKMMTGDFLSDLFLVSPLRAEVQTRILIEGVALSVLFSRKITTCRYIWIINLEIQYLLLKNTRISRLVFW